MNKVFPYFFALLLSGLCSCNSNVFSTLKDVGILTNSSNNYNISSGIRQKLQINQGETNLSKYVQELLLRVEADN